MGRTSKPAGKPKGKMTGYAFFVQEFREDQKKREPSKTASLSVISKQAGEKWKGMSNSDKKKYMDLAAKDELRYKQEMAEYVPPEDDGPKKRKRAAKDPNAPKRALSAFFCFSNEERAKVKADNPKFSIKETAIELGRRWEVCSNRSRYEDMAAKDKERYLREKADYENGGTNGKTTKQPAAKGGKAAKSKPPPKKSRRAKETEDEEDEDEEEEEPNDDDDEEEDDDEDEGSD